MYRKITKKKKEISRKQFPPPYIYIQKKRKTFQRAYIEERKKISSREKSERKFFQSIIYSRQKGEIRTGDFLEKLFSGIYRKKKEIRKVSFLLYIEEEQKDFLSSFVDSLPSIVNRKSFSEAQQDLPSSGATRKENFLRILSKKTRKTD